MRCPYCEDNEKYESEISFKKHIQIAHPDRTQALSLFCEPIVAPQCDDLISVGLDELSESYRKEPEPKETAVLEQNKDTKQEDEVKKMFGLFKKQKAEGSKSTSPDENQKKGAENQEKSKETAKSEEPVKRYSESRRTYDITLFIDDMPLDSMDRLLDDLEKSGYKPKVTNLIPSEQEI